MFAYGMTLYEMLSFHLPFYNEPLLKRNYLVCERQCPLLHGRERRSPVLYQDLMTMCWRHEPHDRPNMTQAQEWIGAPEFERLRAEVDLKDIQLISCACVCRVSLKGSNLMVETKEKISDSETTVGSEFECKQLVQDSGMISSGHDKTFFEPCTQIWICGYTHDQKPKAKVIMYKDGQTEQYSIDMVRVRNKSAVTLYNM